MTTAELNPPKTMEAANRIPPMPYDLLGPIFEHLKDNKASLCAISLASNTFRQEAQCILFREFTASLDRYKCLAFLHAVVASPTRLALFVHTYENGEHIMDPPDKVISEQALKAMRNLKRLVLDRTSLDDDMRILRDCTFSLERFDWSASPRGAELLEWFLPSQNMLKHLGVECYEGEMGKLGDGQWTSAANCRQLVSIAGSWDMIEALLPGRRITTLSLLSGGFVLNATSAKSLAMELKYIKALSLSVFYIKPRDVSVLQHFPSLESLEITELFDNWDIEHLHCSPLFFETLSSLFALQTLVLTGTNETYLYLEDHSQQFLPRLFDKLGKNLKYIDVQADWEIYERHTRNSIFTQEISDAEARKVWLAEPIA